MVATKKMGRPSNNPKGKPIHVRLDEKTNEILEEYCKQNKISKADGIRKGINKLEKDLK